jgi:peptidylprolyl isomerase
MQTRIIVLIALLAALVVAVVIAGTGGDDGDSSEPPTKPEVEVPQGPPPGQLEVTDITDGGGTEARGGDTVTDEYVGVNSSDGKEFDSSWGPGDPLTFQLGAGSVIPGWDQGIPGMRVGGRRQLVIPPDLAYGEAGSPPDIGPNESLVFVVDLLEVQPGG